MAFLFLLPPFAGVAVAALLWAAGKYQSEVMPLLSPEWLAIAGLTVTVLGLCIVGFAVTRRLLGKFTEGALNTALFERSVARRVAALELLPVPEPAPVQREYPAAAERFAETLRTAHSVQVEAKPAAIADTGNVVQLDLSRPEKRVRQPLREIEAAISTGRHDAWYQPVVSLPDRKTRYLSGQAYLLPEGEQPVAPGNWLETANAMGKGPAIDRFMLLDGIKLWRDLNRSQKQCGIIWRLGRATLGDKAVWGEIIELMKANRAVGKTFICEISLAEYGKLSHAEQDALFAVREAGFRLGLGDCRDVRALANALKAGVFSMAGADVAAIAEPAGLTALRSGDVAVEFVATGVAGEDHAISLIDRDVTLAQGPLFAPAKPLRRGGGKAVAPEGAA